MFRSARIPPYNRRLNLEALEARMLLSTCTVDTLADTGAGSDWTGDLRYCISKVNAEPGPDVIDFTVTGTINLGSALPDLTSELDIQGPGADQLTVRRNSSTFRIFMVLPGSTVQISGLTMTNGKGTGAAKPWGGAIYTSGATTLRGVAIVANSSGHNSGTGTGRGGGVYNDGTLIIEDSVISNNTVPDVLDCISSKGGGIFTQGPLTVVNTTIAANSVAAFGSFSCAVAQGGGIASEGGPVNISHSTIANNTASGNQVVGAGGISGSIASIRNSIVADNTPSDCSPSCSATFNIIGGAPMLGPLQDNGGPTKSIALLPGSPAINAGDNTDATHWDQRGVGFPRIVNGTVDIGAFELSDGVTNTNDSGPGSLRQAILNANANPGVDTITFNVAAGYQTIAPGSALPDITEAVIIDGTTQPGYAGTPLIEIWGLAAGAGVDGLTLVSNNSIVKGVMVNLFDGHGIRITGTGNQIEDTFIGVDVSGAIPVANTLSGVYVTGTNNEINGNLIAFNGGNGLLVDDGDGNAVSQNSIHSNGGLGIELANGGNNDQRAPSVNSAVAGGGTTTMAVSLALSAPSTPFTIEFFSSAVCDPSNFGEGETYLGSKTLTTKETGRGRTVFVFGAEVPVGHVITATATSPVGDTSEFSKCLSVTAPPAPIPGNRFGVPPLPSGATPVPPTPGWPDAMLVPLRETATGQPTVSAEETKALSRVPYRPYLAINQSNNMPWSDVFDAIGKKVDL